jgi:glycolate oxidase FAD binding subunit
MILDRRECQCGGPDGVDLIRRFIPDLHYYYVWGGGLVWLTVPVAVDAGTSVIRAAVAAVGGHATLVRAPAELRTTLEVFQPLGSALRKIAAGLKASFDPIAILEPGRMYAGI